MLIVNPELQKKKQDLKQLEKKYQSFIFKRDELLNNIEEFNNDYNLKFGDILNEILVLKEENLYKKIELRKLKTEKLLHNKNILKSLKDKEYKIQAKLDKVILDIKLSNEINHYLLAEKEELEIALKEVKSQIEFIKIEKDGFEREIQRKGIDELEDELYEAKNDKKEFNEELKESEKIYKLNDDEKQELKKLYRKLSKLIHPDVVEDEYKLQAEAIMSKLNELYKYRKLNDMKKLANEIQNKNFIFVSDRLDEIEIIQKRIYQIKDKIVEILNEIDEIKSNEVFNIIENKMEYFNSIQDNLTQRLNDLKNEKSYLDINIMKYQDF